MNSNINRATDYFTYAEFKSMILELYDSGKASGPIQSDALFESTKMSIQRIKKVG